MKTRTINIYTHADLILPEHATVKNRVLSWMREHWGEYTWADDAIESLTAGIKYFGGTLQDYSIDFYGCGRDSYLIDYPDEITREQIEAAGTYNPETLKGDGECKFTGVCFDEDFLDGVRIAFFAGETEPEALINAGIKSWKKACELDYEYQMSEAALLETIEANEYEFLESGKVA